MNTLITSDPITRAQGLIPPVLPGMSTLASIIQDSIPTHGTRGERKILPYGPKSRAFALRHPSLDKRITILEGSIRSSKTWTMIPKELQLCGYDIPGHKVLTGVSKATIYNNVLDDLFEILTPQNYTYNRQSGELDLMGSKWLVMGARDEGSEKYVRGLTIGVLVGDEGVLQPRSFVMMALNRMSPAGARAYFTTNPDSPYHYFKEDLIDNKALQQAGDIEVIHFDLDDNPNLTQEYKDFVHRAYKGVYFLRFVKGLWVVADGAIYGDCWDEAVNAYDGPCPIDPLKIVEECIVTDCGVGHPQVYVHVLDDGYNLYFDREYYWDSAATMRQKTDGQYADDLQEFMAGGNAAGMAGRPCPGAQVIIPPECASFEAELVQRGMWLCTADNEVLDGIRMVSTMFGLRRILISKERCPKGIKEIPSYCWNPKSALRGVEEPIKKKDDFCDTIRYYVKTKIAAWRLAMRDPVPVRTASA